MMLLFARFRRVAPFCDYICVV